MGSGGSKACSGSSAAVVGEAEAVAAAAASYGGGGRRRRLRTNWGFHSSCLGSPSASHDNDDDGEQVSNLWLRKRQGSTSRRRMMVLEPRNQEDLDGYKESKDKVLENERHCMSSNELELDDCGEASISNMPIRNGGSARDSSTQSLSTPGRIFSHFRFIPGNLSSRLSRSSSSRSLSNYPVSSSRTMLNDQEGVTSPSEATSSLIDRNGSLQGSGALLASHLGRDHAQGFEVSPCTLPSNCPAYHVSDDSQRDHIICPIDSATRELGAMGVQADANVRSPRATSDVNCSDAGFLDRRPGVREPSERNVRFSRTLSVGRLRDRVLRRSSLSDLTYHPPQQGEDSDAILVGTGPGSGGQVSASVAEDNSVTSTSMFGQSPSSISRALFGVQDHQMQTSRAREGRYQDLLEHRSNFLERRRRIRSQVRALQRLGSRFEDVSGHDRYCVLAGQNQTGRCTCRAVNHNASATDETNARASISRIVMLAEALFEVLDEIHQQSVVLSSQPSVSSIGSVPAPNDVVDSLPMKLYTKSHRERNEETSQCYICLLEYEEGDTIRILPCYHEFHRACVDKWLKEIHRVCPLCRGDICRYDPSSEHQ